MSLQDSTVINTFIVLFFLETTKDNETSEEIMDVDQNPANERQEENETDSTNNLEDTGIGLTPVEGIISCIKNRNTEP